MGTITQPISACAAQRTRIQAQLGQIKEVQEAIREADNDDFATETQVNVVFTKYGV
jgi:chaperonin cofactor prefoldin